MSHEPDLSIASDLSAFTGTHFVIPMTTAGSTNGTPGTTPPVITGSIRAWSADAG